jgi:hypothetical protein
VATSVILAILPPVGQIICDRDFLGAYTVLSYFAPLANQLHS